MKYIGMPQGMWLLFKTSFRKNLQTTLGLPAEEAKSITAAAHKKYKEIIRSLPEFERADRFKMNIISCAMLAGFYLNMPVKPSLQEMTQYYKNAMMTPAMKWFCKRSGKNKFSPKDIASMKQTARLKAADRNPYSWNMDLYEYPDGSGYEARFTRCGICTLLRELGIPEITPAMCHLDYTMSEAGGVSVFVREYTIASGGAYCDCGYQKKG